MNEFVIVIPFWNGHRTINRLLDSLPSGLPVMIVDDQSDNPIDVAGRPNVRVHRMEQRGYFAGAVNKAIELNPGKGILILNQDVWFSSTRWQSIIDDRYGLGGHGVFGHPAWPAGYVQGTFMWMRSDAIKAVGPFNAECYPLWGCTAEWQLRACRMGFAALPLREIPGMHHEERQGSRYGQAITEALRREPGKRSLFIRTPPEITVAVPCYSYGRFLWDCINSLIGGDTSLGRSPGQSFQSFEVIIVDDASPDVVTRDTGTLIASDQMKGIRYLRHETNQGCPAAINTAIRHGFGKFCTVLSADDMREPDALRRLFEVVLHDPSLVAYDDIMYFANGKKFKGLDMGEYSFEKLLQKNFMHPGIMYARAAWERVGGYHSLMRDGREDWAFNVGLGRLGFCGQHVKYPGFLYRREGQNRTIQTATSDWRQTFLSNLRRLYPDLYEGELPMGCCGNRGARPTRGTAPASTRSAKSRVVGREPMPAGLVEIEYIGGEAGVSTWFGPVTRRQYRFGGKRTRGFVDQADAPEMVGTTGPMGKRGIVIEGRTIFRYAAQASNPVPAKPQGVLGDQVSAELVDTGARGPQAKPGPSPRIVVDSYGQADKGKSLPVPPSDYGDKPVDVEPAEKSARERESTMNVAEMTARRIIEFVEEYLKGDREGFDWQRLIDDEMSGRNRATVIAALERARDKQG